MGIDEVKDHLGDKRSNEMRYEGVLQNFKVFVELALISLFLHQFHLNLNKWSLGNTRCELMRMIGQR